MAFRIDHCNEALKGGIGFVSRKKVLLLDLKALKDSPYEKKTTKMEVLRFKTKIVSK